MLRGLIGSGLFALALTVQAEPAVVRVCADPDPPPWSFWVRDAQGNKTTAISGFSIDLMNEVFARLNSRVEWIGDYPWARCMKEVESGKVDFALGAYYNDERAKTFAYSAHYSTLTPQVFFSRQQPIKVTAKADLKRYRGCGMIGASYAHYDLSAADLESGVNTYDRLIKKLKANRCDFFVEELEIVAGHKGLGFDYLADTDILHNAVSDASAPAHHLIAAKGSPAENMIPEINKALGKMISSGEAARLWRKYTKGLPYKP